MNNTTTSVDDFCQHIKKNVSCVLLYKDGEGHRRCLRFVPDSSTRIIVNPSDMGLKWIGDGTDITVTIGHHQLNNKHLYTILNVQNRSDTFPRLLVVLISRVINNAPTISAKDTEKILRIMAHSTILDIIVATGDYRTAVLKQFILDNYDIVKKIGALPQKLKLALMRL